MSHGPDHWYKVLFSYRELVHRLVVDSAAPGKPEAIDFDRWQRVNASYVSDTGRERRGDMVWRLRLADEDRPETDPWLYVYLLLEFQSEPDTWMALRVQTYVGLLLQDLARRKELSPDGKLPLVLPIVLYTGMTEWEEAMDLSELLVKAPARLKSLQPAQRYLLVDRRSYPPKTSDSSLNLIGTLFHLEHARDRHSMDRALQSLSELLADPKYQQLRQDFARFASWLLQRKAGDSTIPEMTDLQEIRKMLADPKRELEWWERWKLEGEIRGEEVGLRKGEARLLHHQLERRFGRLPQWVEDRLAKAMEGDILRWGEGILDAASLEELFGS